MSSSVVQILRGTIFLARHAIETKRHHNIIEERQTEVRAGGRADGRTFGREGTPAGGRAGGRMGGRAEQLADVQTGGPAYGRTG